MLKTFAGLLQNTGRYFFAVRREVRGVKKSGEPLLKTQALFPFILMYNLFSLIHIKILFFYSNTCASRYFT